MSVLERVRTFGCWVSLPVLEVLSNDSPIPIIEPCAEYEDEDSLLSYRLGNC